MKRSVKNMIMFVIIVLVCGSMFLTMKYVNQSSVNNETTRVQISNDDPTSSNRQDESASNQNDAIENNSEGEPPEKPEDDAFKPSDKEMPDMENEETHGDMGNNPQPMEKDSGTTGLSYVYYVIFGIESFILSASIIYLIISKMNKKTFKETFKNCDKIMIYVLSVFIMTAALNYASIKITDRFFLNQSSQTMIKSSVTYSGVTTITEDATIDSGNYTSTVEDENAILVSGDVDVTLSDISVTKNGDSDGGDESSFYGNNSAVLAKDGANLVMKNITVTTDATGANGIFCYGGSATTGHSSGDGTTVTMSDSNITTNKDNSGGIMVTGGGILNAYDLTVNTAGVSSAAIRTDRGGGTVTVDGGTYTTTGAGSPAIYSTADVTVSHATLIAKSSEGIVIEGNNTVTIDNCQLTDSNTQLNGQSTTYKNIFLYQSMSGDADEGVAEFTAKNSNITTQNGDTLYVTNTTAQINLENNTIINNDTNGYFLRAQKDSWGKSGSNGGNVTLVMTNQNVTGNIMIDSISTLDMNLTDKSYYEGAINEENSAKSISLTLDKSSQIKLTGDSYVTSLEDEDGSYSNIDFNGYKLYVNGKAIN